MKKLNTKAGFTLAELLIVVAIIAVLVAISIPVFSAQLERSRENTDLANMRAAKAEILAYFLESSEQYVLNASGVKGTEATAKPASGTGDGTDFTVNAKDTFTTYYVYDGTTGDLAVNTYQPKPYGKGTAGGEYSTVAANGVLFVAVDTEGTVKGMWGTKDGKKLDDGTTALTATDLKNWNELY